MRDTVNRRIEILQILSVLRFTTLEKLAFEFEVHKNTILNDIKELSG